jgi:predicted lysophospholipase L1 biosynthesis ABC-type transport system permease subunit
MTPEEHHRRFRPVMWGAIGVSFFLLALVAVLRLDPRIAGYTLGALVLVCLVVCVAAFWMDSRAKRATALLASRLRNRSTRS